MFVPDHSLPHGRALRDRAPRVVAGHQSKTKSLHFEDHAEEVSPVLVATNVFYPNLFAKPTGFQLAIDGRCCLLNRLPDVDPKRIRAEFPERKILPYRRDAKAGE